MPEIPYVWDDNKVNLIATEGGDEEACIKLISSFFSSLGIKYVSEATVKKLYNHGFDTLKKILLAKVKDLKGIPGLGEKSAERIVENIRNGLKNSDVPTVIGASGIFGNGIGVRKINALVSAIPDIFKREYSPSILKKKVYSVEGFADKTTDKIVTSVPVAIKFLEMVNDIVVIPEREVVSNSLSGQIFVFTGFRDKELEKKITERGGKVTGSVSKKTNGLIVKSKESEKESSKFKKAVELNVEIYTIDEFNSTFLSD
jgi:DNA ligase (NAD+)